VAFVAHNLIGKKKYLKLFQVGKLAGLRNSGKFV
jgi:hypothetical protein